MEAKTATPEAKQGVSNYLIREPEHRSGLADFWLRFKRNRLAVIAAVILIIIHVLAFAAPIVAPFTPERIDLNNRLVTMNGTYWLGTDENGRDIFSRLLFGGRVSLIVGLAAVAISVIVGTPLGAISGYAGGWVDAVVMRITDAFLAIPTFFLLLTVLTLFGTSLTNIVLVIGFTSWMAVARVVRGEVLKTRNEEFVTAARVSGASPNRIVARHVLPQAIPSIIVSATLGVAFAILTESSLSFLGLGVQAPLPSWGNMLSASQYYVWSAPRLAVYPGVLIVITVLAYNVLGNALRDTLDPRLRGR
jgi:peptide/nickel transport system permease protein